MHGGESHVAAAGHDRQRRAVGGMNGMKFLAVDGHGFDIGNILDAEMAWR